MKTKILSIRRWRLSAMAAVPQPQLLLPILLTACAAVLWACSLRGLDIRRMNDLGLVSVLPRTAYLALLSLTAGFCLTLRQRSRAPVAMLLVVVLILMLYSPMAFIGQIPGFGPAWRHVGVTEYVIRNGTVDPKIDAYFNWPGFFILSAFVAQVAGLRSAVGFVPWAPVFFNLLYLGPLIMILSSATDDRRVIWLGVWFFYLTNWVGQDYYSPQALSYFVYLTIVGILLTWFKTARQPGATARPKQRLGVLTGPAARAVRWLTAADGRSTPSQPWQRMVLLLIVVALFGLTVSSHQLTPFSVLAAVTALVILNRTSLRGLPILMAVMIGAWLVYMATPFLAGNLPKLVSSVGRVGATVNANLGARLHGSPAHGLVVRACLTMALAAWGLALAGLAQRVRRGFQDVSYAVLAVAPFPLLLLQSYGGEMLLRIYLFALPCTAFFAAALFQTMPATAPSWRKIAAIGLVSVGLLGGFCVVRYGNERQDSFTSQELLAVRHVYSTAKPGSLVVTSSSNLPYKFQDYEKYHYALVGDAILAGDVKAITGLMRNRTYPAAYLILTRAQRAHLELFHGLPLKAWDQVEGGLMQSPAVRLEFANEDAKVFVVTNSGKERLP